MWELRSDEVIKKKKKKRKKVWKGVKEGRGMWDYGSGRDEEGKAKKKKEWEMKEEKWERGNDNVVKKQFWHLSSKDILLYN